MLRDVDGSRVMILSEGLLGGNIDFKGGIVSGEDRSSNKSSKSGIAMEAEDWNDDMANGVPEARKVLY